MEEKFEKQKPKDHLVSHLYHSELFNIMNSIFSQPSSNDSLYGNSFLNYIMT